jgi:acetoin utilization deacetylase AcuC-like enzyme
MHFLFFFFFYLGGTVLAAEISLERGLACSTAGGTHHAFPD